MELMLKELAQNARIQRPRRFTKWVWTREDISMSGPGPVEEREMTVSANPIYDYKVGDEVLVEGIAFDLNQTRAWSTAKIFKLIPSVAGCYEIEFLSTGKRSIVHEYRLRRQV